MFLEGNRGTQALFIAIQALYRMTEYMSFPELLLSCEKCSVLCMFVVIQGLFKWFMQLKMLEHFFQSMKKYLILQFNLKIKSHQIWRHMVFFGQVSGRRDPLSVITVLRMRLYHILIFSLTFYNPLKLWKSKFSHF